MTTSHRLTSENCTAYPRIKLENGSRDLDSGKTDIPARKPSGTDWSSKSQVLNLVPISGYGTEFQPPTSSTRWNIRGQFQITTNGSIGQEILDCDGQIIAWATDPVIAQVICKILTEFVNQQTH